MTTYDDIQKAVNIFRKASCPFELMHTVSTYPMQDENANLKMIKPLRKDIIAMLAIVVMKLV